METEFRNKVTVYLNILNNELEKVLKQLINYSYPNEVISLDFEIFPDEFTEGFPVRVFFMDKDNSEFFVYHNGKATYPSPVDPDLLKITHVYPYEFIQKFEEKDEDFNSWDIATQEMIQWFALRWKHAGGNQFQLKASISAHDRENKFDLVKQKWTNE